MDTEQKLIRKIQRLGDRKSAEILIGNYYDEIYRYAYRQTGEKQSALDLTQDIFVAVLQAISGFDSQRSGFRTWLYRVATHKSIDRFRKNGHLSMISLDSSEIEMRDEISFIDEIENRDLMNRLVNYIAELDFSQQQVFRLHFFADYTFAEIAKILALPESTVKSKYYRLIKQMRKDFSI